MLASWPPSRCLALADRRESERLSSRGQLRHDTIGRRYYDRKLEQGKTSKEALRALKRRISDSVYRHLTDDARQLRS